MSTYIPQHLRRWLETLGERCEYCQTSEFVTGITSDLLLTTKFHLPSTRPNLVARPRLHAQLDLEAFLRTLSGF